MINNFPIFTKLHPDQKTEAEQVTNLFPPYSDHNFTSLLAWDVSTNIELSLLNNNLVIKFKDYESDKTFLSFIGNNLVEDTLDRLITYSSENGHGSEILLLPKDNFSDEQLKSLTHKYNFTEDRDNFDYILNIEDLANFSGTSYLNKRNKLNHFIKNQKPHVVIKTLEDPSFQQELLECFESWIKHSQETNNNASINHDEFVAFKRLLLHHESTDVFVLAVYIDNKIQGFSIFEILSQEYAQHPFQKANKDYKGIYEFLNNTLAKHLKEKGIKYLNIYQDLGHEGIRKGKTDYNPTFLKKYKVSKSAN